VAPRIVRGRPSRVKGAFGVAGASALLTHPAGCHPPVRPLTREPLPPPRAGRGLPGGALGATGGGLTPMIEDSARKRADPTRKRAEAPIMAAEGPDDRRSSALAVVAQ
jgi:hypothetical protein